MKMLAMSRPCLAADNNQRPWSLWAVMLVMAACLVLTGPVSAITVDWVTVGDLGNEGYQRMTHPPVAVGSVSYEYRIMKYEWTNTQYVAFLNSVDPEGANLRGLYHEYMGWPTNPIASITLDASQSSGTKYSVLPNMGNKPVSYMTWLDVVRVANWMHNGQGSGDTETGAYTIDSTTVPQVLPARNAGARYWIPTWDEWHKAAYYKGGSTNAGYWEYPTQSDEVPAMITADASGNGSAGPVGNAANYGVYGTNYSGSYFGQPTTVGTNGGPSSYGTFDMAGNVTEWSENAWNDTWRFHLGGNFRDLPEWYYTSSASYVDAKYWDAGSDGYMMGFRLASAPVPELDISAGISAIVLLCGVLGVMERRRSHLGATRHAGLRDGSAGS